MLNVSVYHTLCCLTIHGNTPPFCSPYLLLYPKENLQKFLSEKQAYREVWDALRNISISDMEVEGRIYGGGLKKIEPKELAKVKCNNLQSVLK